MSKLAFQMPDMSDTPHFPPAILEKLTALQAKYAATGQDLAAYLTHYNWHRHHTGKWNNGRPPATTGCGILDSVWRA